MNIKDILAKAAKGEELTEAEVKFVEDADSKAVEEAEEKAVSELAEKLLGRLKEEGVVSEEKKEKKADKMTDEDIRKDFFSALIRKDTVGLQKYMSNEVAGAILVPTVVYREILNFLKEETSLLGSTTLIENCPATLDVTAFATKPVAYFRGEAARKTVSTPTVEKQTLTPYSVSVLVTLTNEFIEDVEGISGLVIGLMQDALAEKLDSEIAAGNGVGKPTGLENYYATYLANNKITIAQQANLVDRVVVASVRLKKQYRSRARWYMNTGQAERLQLAKDTTGRYLLTEDMTGEFAGVIKGKPVVINDDLTNIWFGDLTSYFSGQRGGINIAESAEATIVDGATTKNLFQDNMRALRVETRFDGELVNQKGLVVVQAAP